MFAVLFAVFAAVCAVAALAMPVFAFVFAVSDVDLTAAATVLTSEGSLDVAPDVPFSPSQKLAHARASFVLTVDAAAPVAVPPSTACTVPSTTVCRFVVAVFAVEFAVFAVPCAAAAFAMAVFANACASADSVIRYKATSSTHHTSDVPTASAAM